ncbi:anionic trypsin-like, partial [Malurus melanocephalus]|uniref:anionic trypsin-like n=1 Tax=Malurus melanocephalus TaxID=175006 RepID=UPI002546A5F3
MVTLDLSWSLRSSHGHFNPLVVTLILSWSLWSPGGHFGSPHAPLVVPWWSVTPAAISERVRPIAVASCLPRPGTACLTSGWGATTSPEVTYPEVLQCVNVTLFSADECRRFYPGSITDNMICAGNVQGGTDSCQVRAPKSPKSPQNHPKSRFLKMTKIALEI